MFEIIILAAGDSTRMNSKVPKTLHKVGNFPVIEHIIYNSLTLNIKNLSIVINENSHQEINSIVKKYSIKANIVCQKDRLGTGHATKIALETFSHTILNDDIVLILYGDTPLITKDTITQMLNLLYNSDSSIVLLGFHSSNSQYGKIITDSNNNVIKIIESQDFLKEKLSPYQANLSNSGIMIGYKKIIRQLVRELKDNSGKYYLTDIISSAYKHNLKTGLIVTNESEAIGINNRFDLHKAEFYFQQQKRGYFMNLGVTLLAPEHCFFSLDTEIAKDCTVHPYVIMGPKVQVEQNVEILSYSHLEHCLIKESSVIGPFTRIRDKTIIGEKCQIGNFVEVKESTIDNQSKIKHLSYIGNSNIGNNTNVGSGVAICNYDGQKKHSTNIGQHCFIGANSTLIAPIEVGSNSTIAAGSTIVNNVPDQSLAIAREKQYIKQNYKLARNNKHPNESITE